MWDLPEPGLESVSSVLAGGFLTIAPPGKPIIDLDLLLYHLCPAVVCLGPSVGINGAKLASCHPGKILPLST